MLNEVKFTLQQAMKAQKGSTLSLISALDAGVWLSPLLGRFTHGKEIRFPL